MKKCLYILVLLLVLSGTAVQATRTLAGQPEDLAQPNLALAKPVRVSAFLPEEPPENAVDGEESAWNAGANAPQWVEIDLQKPATVTLVQLVTEQYPAGVTVHQLWGGGPGEEIHLLHEFDGRTETGQVLAFQPEAPLANIQLIRVVTTASPSWVAWREIKVYGTHDDSAPGISTLRFDISEHAGQTVALELIAEGDDQGYAGMFVNAVQVETSTGSDPCAAIKNCDFAGMAQDTAWQKHGRLRFTNQEGEDTGSWWGNNHTGGFWHDGHVSQTITLPPDATTLVVEVCTSCEWSTDGSPSPTEYNARLSVRVDGRYLADHADPLPGIDASSPFRNLALGQPVTASRSLPEAPPENAVDGTPHKWGAGSHPPQWIEVDLGQPTAVALMRLVVDQYPAGLTVHQIWGRGPDEELSLLYEFRGHTASGDLLAFTPEIPVPDLQFIRILTTQSPSWVAWTEIEVFAASDFSGTQDFDQSDGHGDGVDAEPALPSGNVDSGQMVATSPIAPGDAGGHVADSEVTVELLYPALAGAFIALEAEPLQPGLWTRIQWKDAFGDWHDIEGWQGAFNPDQRVLWYVGEEMLGDGPFRWLVFASQAGSLLAVSPPFHLPSHNGEVMRVAVSLPLRITNTPFRGESN
ncbi:MAG: discoidin domain-containing protein [Anaerolineaceae bacterium]|nr:discoidin domain-containing protein [Anaerolineaceae bacterium]